MFISQDQQQQIVQSEKKRNCMNYEQQNSSQSSAIGDCVPSQKTTQKNSSFMNVAENGGVHFPSSDSLVLHDKDRDSVHPNTGKSSFSNDRGRRLMSFLQSPPEENVTDEPTSDNDDLLSDSSSSSEPY